MTKFYGILILIIAGLSCVTIPKYPAPPDGLKTTEVCTVKIIRNPVGKETFSGKWDFSSHKLGGRSHIVFAEQYKIDVPESWEIADESLIFKNYQFNNDAIFELPAGTYHVSYYAKLRKWVFGMGAILPSTDIYFYKVGSFTFEPKKKYQIHVTVGDVRVSGTSNNKKPSIIAVTIDEVKSFKQIDGFN